jgi:hypothetical protein
MSQHSYQTKVGVLKCGYKLNNTAEQHDYQSCTENGLSADIGQTWQLASVLDVPLFCPDILFNNF